MDWERSQVRSRFNYYYMTTIRALQIPAAAFLILSLLLGSCTRDRSSVAVDASILTMVPADAVAIGAIRVKALRDTSAWKKLLEQKDVIESFDKLAAETSFDVRKDLWEIMWSHNGKETLVLARGHFTEMGMEPTIEREGIQRMSYKGTMLLGNEETAVWFVNASTAVFGRTTELHRLIDARDTRSGGPPESLRARLEQIPPSAHFWMVADATRLPKPSRAELQSGELESNLFQNLPKLLQSVQFVESYADLNDGVAITVSVLCADEAGARQAHDSARGLLGLARFGLPPTLRTELTPVLDSVTVEQKQTQTFVRARLTTEEFEKLQAAIRPKGNRKEKRSD